ncbi:hypothetical protein CCYA_CCYA18G4600 [Cyanidiococcus yangmingshanensis]|nr:hypothetical protein CCYA_CCYA18G4600 [Cyanidiococcus yangmingshanensis]
MLPSTAARTVVTVLLCAIAICGLVSVASGTLASDVRAQRTVFVIHPQRAGEHRVSLDTPPNPATTCTFRYEQVHGASPETWELQLYGDRAAGELACRVRRVPSGEAAVATSGAVTKNADFASEHDEAAPSYLFFGDFAMVLGDGSTTVIEASAVGSEGNPVPTEDLVWEGARLQSRSGFMGSLRSVTMKALLY